MANIRKTLFMTGMLLTLLLPSKAQDTTFYLLTCGPGTQTYSVYGHSALRMSIPAQKIDTIYNWGVFDFSVSNFAWKFSKGGLDYYLDTDRFGRFLQEYFLEKRFVLSQRINLEPAEKARLAGLIRENLRPENVKYRYDFFYDDCSTRIRDLLEKATGNRLIYPAETGIPPTFRDLIGKYQKPYPWLRWGVDLLVGSPADIEAGVRERMFLPIPMMEALSETEVNRNGKTMPLLQDPDTILDFESPSAKKSILLSPVSIFTILLSIVLMLSFLIKKKTTADIMDIMLFALFSILAILMIFFNFFADHAQTHWNFNIIWLNPFLFIVLGKLLSGKPGIVWFRIVFVITAIFIAGQFFIPQVFNKGIYPLVLIILVRSYARSEFKWNPFPAQLNQPEVRFHLN